MSSDFTLIYAAFNKHPLPQLRIKFNLDPFPFLFFHENCCQDPDFDNPCFLFANCDLECFFMLTFCLAGHLSFLMMTMMAWGSPAVIMNNQHYTTSDDLNDQNYEQH